MRRLGRTTTRTLRLVAAGAMLLGASYGCSLVVDTDDLTGGDAGASDAAALREAGRDASGASGSDGSDGSGDDGSLDAGADGAAERPAPDGITDTTCVPRSCAAQAIACGDASDGCGRQLDCGQCHLYGQVCVSGTCGCTPKTSASCSTGLCGAVPDGCGGFYECPPCPSGSSCGPDNACMLGTCAQTSDPQNSCGTISDGCGGTRTAGSICPTNNLNNACNGGPTADRCGCFGSSCAQQGYACSIPSGPPVGDRCQDPNLTCSGCTYPPGQCTTTHQCTSCTRVAAPAFPWDTQCAETARSEAWACDCADGGACVVPDGLQAAPPTCAYLLSTSAHGIYCCAPAKN